MVLTSRDFQALVEHVEADAAADPPAVFHHWGPNYAISLGPEGSRALRAAQREITGTARSQALPSEREAQRLLVDACARAIDAGAKAAYRWLLRELAKPLTVWTVAQPVDVHLPGRQLTIGACRLTTRFPIHSSNLLVNERAASMGMDGPAIMTEVLAHDHAAARALAAIRIDESLAVVEFLGPSRPLDRTLVSRDATGLTNHHHRSVRQLINTGWVDARGHLVAPIHQVSRALACQVRTDWQQRVIAAMRWWAEAGRTTWSSARLVQLMSALECLFVAPNTQAKGATIAAGVSHRFGVQHMSREELDTWLADLYRGRNASIHQGSDYAHDLTLDRLANVTRYIIHSEPDRVRRGPG